MVHECEGWKARQSRRSSLIKTGCPTFLLKPAQKQKNCFKFTLENEIRKEEKDETTIHTNDLDTMIK